MEGGAVQDVSVWDSTHSTVPLPLGRCCLAAATLCWWLLGGAGHLVHGLIVGLRTTLFVDDPSINLTLAVGI